jgi:hypothetical protein
MIPLLKFVKTSKRKLNKRLQNTSSVENKNGSATIPNTFASSYYFFANTQGNAKKIIRACKPILPKLRKTKGEERRTTDNKVLAKWGQKYKTHYLLFY